MHPGGSSGTPPRPSRRVPSLKLKRLNVAKHRQQSRDSNPPLEDGFDATSARTTGGPSAAGSSASAATASQQTSNSLAPSANGNASQHGNSHARGGSGTSKGGGPPTTMPFLLTTGANSTHPAITITLESDTESVYSDYLSPEINYHQNNVKDHFLGDETSLYGTPKEELMPGGSAEMHPQSEQKPSPTSYLKDQILTFFQPSDNKLAMKLFGNKNALMKEKMRHKSVGNWVIHPCSNFR